MNNFTNDELIAELKARGVPVGGYIMGPMPNDEFELDLSGIIGKKNCGIIILEEIEL